MIAVTFFYMCTRAITMKTNLCVSKQLHYMTRKQLINMLSTAKCLTVYINRGALV